MSHNKLLLLIPFLLSALCSGEEALLSKPNRALLEPIRQTLQSSSIVLSDDSRKSIGYGCLVSTTGHILTKASLLPEDGPILVRHDKREFEAQLLQQSREWDVALLQIKLSDASPLTLYSPSPSHGQIIVSNGVTSLLKRRLKFGIISANARPIAMQDACLDLLAFHDQEKCLVHSVKEDGEAHQAGLKKGDHILSIDDQPLNDPLKPIIHYYKGKWPGDTSTLVIARGEERLTVPLTYQWRHLVHQGPQDRNEGMSGRISQRRTGFPMILQHDIPLSARTIGGPLLDLEGRCIGMNIARFSRSETYAIPASELQKLLSSWKVPLPE